MKFLVKKDKMLRQKYFNLECKIFLGKVLRESIVNNFRYIRFSNKIKSRIRNRCFVTGKSSSVNSKFHLSRMRLRELAHEGLLSGLKKASW